MVVPVGSHVGLFAIIAASIVVVFVPQPVWHCNRIHWFILFFDYHGSRSGKPMWLAKGLSPSFSGCKENTLISFSDNQTFWSFHLYISFMRMWSLTSTKRIWCWYSCGSGMFSVQTKKGFKESKCHDKGPPSLLYQPLSQITRYQLRAVLLGRRSAKILFIICEGE